MYSKNLFKVSGIKSIRTYAYLESKAISGDFGKYTMTAVCDEKSGINQLTWYTDDGDIVCQIHLTDKTVKFEIDNVGSFLVYFPYEKNWDAHIEFRGDINGLVDPYGFGVSELSINMNAEYCEWIVSPYTGPIFSHQIDAMCD